jgi:hypothetical protein
MTIQPHQIQKLFAGILCLFYLNGFSQHLLKKMELPSALINGRFYIKIPTLNGDTILGFCDTGGGYNAIYAVTVGRLHLENKILEADINGEKTKYIPARDIIASPDIPGPYIQNYYQKYITVPFFEIAEDNAESKIIISYTPQDIFLGQFFFIEHAWTFDYQKGRLYINTPLSANANNKNIQLLGFKKDMSGRKRFGHPSMKVEIDGQVIDVLFDSGASILLSKNTRAMLKINSKSIGGSFIAKSIFDAWRQLHPDWSFIEKGEATGADMIQVPQVTVGGATAGPVWFARRPDEAWSRGMIGSMDKVVKGAVGGSLFQYYIVTIDYNSELARFEKWK